jgi:hypothetical protein
MYFCFAGVRGCALVASVLAGVGRWRHRLLDGLYPNVSSDVGKKEISSGTCCVWFRLRKSFDTLGASGTAGERLNLPPTAFMNDDSMVQILAEIRDAQQLQLSHQEEALRIQREQFAAFQKSMEKTERIQDRAERLQERGAQMVGFARKLIFFVIPLLIALLLFAMFGRFFH